MTTVINTRLGLKQTRWLNTVSGYTVLSFLAILFMIPLYWMFSTALKSPQQTFAIPPKWVPAPAKWSNFENVFEEVPFARFYANTVFLVTMNIIGDGVHNLIDGMLIAASYIFYQSRRTWLLKIQASLAAKVENAQDPPEPDIS